MADHARCPGHRYGPLLPRECLAGVAEEGTGEAFPPEGIQFGFDAARAPGGVDGTLRGSETVGEVVMPVQVLRLGDQGKRQLLTRGVAGVLDRPPDRLLPSDRRLGHTRYAERGVDTRGEQPVGVGSEHLYRGADQGVPALLVTLLGSRLAQEEDDLGPRVAGHGLGVGNPVPQRQCPFELDECLGGCQTLRRQSGANRGRQGPGQVVGGVPMEGEPTQRRHPGIGFGVDPGLEDLGQPAVDPGPFVGHQVVIGRLTQQRMPKLQGAGGLAQDVGVQSLPQIALHLGLVESRQLGERLGVQPSPVDRGQAEQRPRARVEGVDPGQQQIREVLGDPLRVGVLVGGQELLGVQRVALGPRQHSIDHRRVGWPVGVGGGDAGNVGAVQPAQIDASGPGGPADLGQGLPERVAAMELVAAEGQHQQQTPTGGPRQRGREVLGRTVRPVHVLQHQQDRTGGRCFEDDRGEVVQHMERLPTPRCVRVQQGQHPPRRRPRPEVLDPG